MTAALTFVLMVMVAITTVTPTPLDVTGTGYTCAYHPNNRMATTPGMCLATYTGADPSGPGVACPESYLGREFYIPDFGILECDDVPYHRTLFGLPHFDIRTTDYHRALSISPHTMRIYIFPLPPPGQIPKGITHASLSP